MVRLGVFAPDAIFVLPPRYRPTTTHMFGVASYYMQKTTMARIVVEPSGIVRLVDPTGDDLTGFDGLNWLSLDGVSFQADT
jgi:hypothetical protein